MAADPLTVAAFVAGPLVNFGLYGDSAPPQNYFAGMTQVERLYRDGERIVSTPILDVSAADAACPNGNQVVRQSSRVDGSREYLVWTLRCR